MKNDFDARLNEFIQSALKEDIGEGDHSTLSTIEKNQNGIAELKIKEEGILAGVAIAQKIFTTLDPHAHFEIKKQDGEAMRVGEIAFIVHANIHSILMGERLALNCMQRMSGIATLTNKYVNRIKNYHTKLLDTRKTTPNFRLLEKEAVRIGGGFNHRFGLYDMIMLKDNHIDFCGGISEAITKAKDYVNKNGKHLKIEVEVRNLDELLTVMHTGNVDRIMLDNFTPDQIIEALKIIDKKYETEASGGITLENIESYAATGVDYISVGALIHQARSLDLSLKAIIIK